MVYRVINAARQRLQHWLWSWSAVLSGLTSGYRISLPFRGDAKAIAKGERVILGKGVVIHEHAYLSLGPMGTLRIGEGTVIGAYFVVSCHELVSIGDRVLMSDRVFITDADHEYGDPSKSVVSQGMKTAPTRIGDDCWIGIGVAILKGVSIGDHCVIGANSVVTQDVPPMAVVAGNPARVVRSRTPC